MIRFLCRYIIPLVALASANNHYQNKSQDAFDSIDSSIYEYDGSDYESGYDPEEALSDDTSHGYQDN